MGVFFSVGVRENFGLFGGGLLMYALGRGRSSATGQLPPVVYIRAI